MENKDPLGARSAPLVANKAPIRSAPNAVATNVPPEILTWENTQVIKKKRGRKPKSISIIPEDTLDNMLSKGSNNNLKGALRAPIVVCTEEFRNLSLGNKECRNNPSKLRFDLISPEMEKALGSILTYGCNKYGPRNWEKGIPSSEQYAAIRRHLFAWLNGEDLDESGFPHLWHAFTDLGMLLTQMERQPALDDLRKDKGV